MDLDRKITAIKKQGQTNSQTIQRIQTLEQNEGEQLTPMELKIKEMED